MDNFNLKKYLAKGKLLKEDETDKLLAISLTDEERDYAGDVLMKMHQQLNPDLDLEKSKEILDFTIATLQEMY